MLATEQARVDSWQLGLSLKGRRGRPNSRIVRGSCPAQVGSKKRGWLGFPIETRFQRQRNRPQISGRARLVRSGPRQGRPHAICQEGLNDRGLSRNRHRSRCSAIQQSPKLRRAECFCSRATLDDLLSDEVMAPVLRSAGYEPDEFREMMTKMAWNPGHPLIGHRRRLVTWVRYSGTP
jgi:hypothetical protein